MLLEVPESKYTEWSSHASMVIFPFLTEHPSYGNLCHCASGYGNQPFSNGNATANAKRSIGIVQRLCLILASIDVEEQLILIGN